MDEHESPKPAALPQVVPAQPSRFVIWLDQWVWVRLAQARKSGSGEFWPLLQRLSTARAEGKIELPLTAQNYLELWNRQNSVSRNELGRVMAELSGYVTLRAVHELHREQVSRAVIEVLQGIAAQPLSRTDVIGNGANYAFSSVTGRYRFIESLASYDREEGPEVEVPADFLEFAINGPRDAWEWVNLVGVDVDYSIPGIDYRPEHRLGDQYVEGKKFLASRVERASAEGSLLYRSLVERELQATGEYIVEAFGSNDAILSYFRGPTDGVAFIGKIPISNVKVELEYRALLNKEYDFKQHDRGDIFSLAHTLPFCDAVWTDAHWSHVARAAKLPELTGCQMILSAQHLSDMIDALESESEPAT